MQHMRVIVMHPSHMSNTPSTMTIIHAAPIHVGTNTLCRHVLKNWLAIDHLCGGRVLTIKAGIIPTPSLQRE